MDSKTPNNLQPMTVAHGKLLHEATIRLREQVEKLRADLLPPEEPTAKDPVEEITNLLQNLAIQGGHLMSELQNISAKMDVVIAALDTGEL